MSKVKFILNDETQVNQKGFRILNAGLNLERFKANPVILADHWNGIGGVIGKWTNIQIEGNQLTAEAEFDEKSELGRRVSEQVADGFIRGCSLGVDPISRDNFQVEPSGTFVLMKGDIYEASIVAIPNNSKALIKLFASQQLMSDEAEQNLLEQLKLNNPMKIALTALAAYIALGFNKVQELEPSQIEEGVLKLKAELDQSQNEVIELKAKIEAYEANKKVEHQKLAAELVDGAIKAGKFPATEREQYMELAIGKPEMAKSIIDRMPGKNSLAGKVEELGGAIPQNLDDFLKLSFNEQMNFKMNFPEEYKKIAE